MRESRTHPFCVVADVEQPKGGIMNEFSKARAPSSTAGLSRANREAILGLLSSQGPLARPQLGELSGMAPATINRLVSSLMKQGLVVASGKREGTGGRPSVVVSLKDDAVLVATLSLEQDVIRKGFYDLGGNLLEREDVLLDSDLRVDERVANALRHAQELIELASRKGYRCVALGVSVPGVVDSDGLVDWAPALNWRSVPLGALLTQRVGIPVAIENDANTLVLAEYHRGASRGVDGMVAIALGGGIGAGIVLGGHLFRGARAAAGEIGYMLRGPASLKRFFPGFGDLEQRVGEEGITRRASELGINGTGDLVAAEVFLRAAQGSRPALELIEDVLDDLAFALANVCVVIDPAVVVLGGGIGAHAKQIIPGLLERLTGRIPHVPSLIGPTFGPEASLIGVGGLALTRAGSPLDLVG